MLLKEYINKRIQIEEKYFILIGTLRNLYVKGII